MWNGISIVKNDENHNKLIVLIWNIYILENFQCILQLNYSFYGGLFIYFTFDITMTYFLSPHFSFYVWNIVSWFQKSIMNPFFS
jgi:hypothetical protein